MRDYSDRIEQVCRQAADELRSCRDDVLAQLRVCCHYFESGERQGISHGELIDFLGVSTPSVLDRAGYSQHESLRVMELLSLIKYDKDGRPKAPESQPHPSPTSPERQQFGI